MSSLPVPGATAAIPPLLPRFRWESENVPGAFSADFAGERGHHVSSVDTRHVHIGHPLQRPQAGGQRCRGAHPGLSTLDSRSLERRWRLHSTADLSGIVRAGRCRGSCGMVGPVEGPPASAREAVGAGNGNMRPWSNACGACRLQRPPNRAPWSGGRQVVRGGGAGLVERCMGRRPLLRGHRTGRDCRGGLQRRPLLLRARRSGRRAPPPAGAARATLTVPAARVVARPGRGGLRPCLACGGVSGFGPLDFAAMVRSSRGRDLLARGRARGVLAGFLHLLLDTPRSSGGRTGTVRTRSPRRPPRGPVRCCWPCCMRPGAHARRAIRRGLRSDRSAPLGPGMVARGVPRCGGRSLAAAHPAASRLERPCPQSGVDGFGSPGRQSLSRGHRERDGDGFDPMAWTTGPAHEPGRAVPSLRDGTRTRALALRRGAFTAPTRDPRFRRCAPRGRGGSPSGAGAIAPHLERFAVMARVFRNAQTTYPATVLALASAFSGLYPSRILLAPEPPSASYVRWPAPQSTSTSRCPPIPGSAFQPWTSSSRSVSPRSGRGSDASNPQSRCLASAVPAAGR